MDLKMIGYNDISGGLSLGLSMLQRMRTVLLITGRNLIHERRQVHDAVLPNCSHEHELEQIPSTPTLLYGTGGWGVSTGEVTFDRMWNDFLRFQPAMFLWTGRFAEKKSAKDRLKQIENRYKVVDPDIRDRYQLTTIRFRPTVFGFGLNHMLHTAVLSTFRIPVWRHKVSSETTVQMIWDSWLVGHKSHELRPELLPTKRTKVTKLLELDAPAPTNLYRRWHPTEDRPLTVKETQTLYGYDVSHPFFGSVKEKLHQITNGISTIEGSIIAPWIQNAFLEDVPVSSGIITESFIEENTSQ